MADIDALYRNAGAFTMFEKLKRGQSIYFNRTIWRDGEKLPGSALGRAR
jgi:hypothetical protein